MKQTTTFLVFLAILSVPLWAQNTEKDFSVQVTQDGGLVITKYTGKSKTVQIPATIQGLPVTGIGQNAFVEHNQKTGSNQGMPVTSITIPNSVTSIENGAFAGCTALKTITLSESLISIGNSAFANCTALTSINLPKSLTTIKDGAFADCIKLDKITLPESLISIGEGVFTGSGLTSITWPAGLPSIMEYSPPVEGRRFYIGGGSSRDTPKAKGMFMNCKSLKTVIISEGVTIIGDNAFSGCTALTSITLPESITSIGNESFNNCTALSSITLPQNLIAIGKAAFTQSGLKTITIPSNIDYIGEEPALWELEEGVVGIFEDCKNLQTVIVLEGVTYLRLNTFRNCTALTSVTLPSTIRTIQYSAFGGCSSLTAITIPESVAEIEFDNSAFGGCKNFTLPVQAALRKLGYTGSFDTTPPRNNKIRGGLRKSG